uniref:Nuclear receptor domain-containing protein n=1 Tax=Panagrolaimus sp. JU765 TaxID=591449 RepID=A0AC34QJ84_9BILA
MVAADPMNLKMQIDPHTRPPFDSQGVFSHMSAPDLSFWSQMEGTSLFCNSAAIAAAASEAAVNMHNNSMPLFGSQGVLDSNQAFQSLAHLPGAFNLNSLTHQDVNFDHLQNHRPPQNQMNDHHPNPSVTQTQQSHHPNPIPFWPNGSPQNHHENSMMFNQNPIQKLSDFRTVMLPTEDKRSPNSPYGRVAGTPIPVGNTIVCQVCLSAPSNGLHFGAKVCAACAAFFRRSVSENKRYICKRSQRCTLKVNEPNGYRKICRECRFKRCLEIGMLPENVQHKRHRREADNVCSPSSNPQSSQQSPHMTNPQLNNLQSDYLDLFNQQHPGLSNNSFLSSSSR